MPYLLSEIVNRRAQIVNVSQNTIRRSRYQINQFIGWRIGVFHVQVAVCQESFPGGNPQNLVSH